MKCFDKKIKEYINPIIDYKINTLDDLILLENNIDFCVIKNIELTEVMLSKEESNFLYFIDKNIFVFSDDLETLKTLMLNPMVNYLLVPEDFIYDLNNFNSIVSEQRDIENIVCHIDYGKIKKYTSKNIKQIVNSVWGYFMIYHIFNVDTDDHVMEYEDLAEELGEIRMCHPVNDKNTNFSKSRDIKFNPDIYHYYASNTRQPLHTDYAYYREDESPDWLMLYCMYPSEYGGITSLISTKTISNILAKYDNELLERIQTKIKYKYNGQDGDKIHEKTLFDGKYINWNYWQIKEELNSSEIMDTRAIFFKFLENVIVDGSIYDISKKWNPKDCIIFNDHLVLHGRSAFIGDRWLKDHAFYNKK